MAIVMPLLNKPFPMQIDGFEQDKKVVVIAATNRKQDLDPALIRYICFCFLMCKMKVPYLSRGLFTHLISLMCSRFDSIIPFGLPDRQNRKEIAAQYAKHLTESELDELATLTEE